MISVEHFLPSAFLTIFLVFPLADKLPGAVYTEIGDAGQTLAEAQPAVSSLGLPLTGIEGFLGPSEADLFALFLTGGRTFSASTVSNTSNFFDTQLFLFHSAGLGVYANDDDPDSPPQSTLPSFVSLTPSASGIYYLGIAGASFNPVSAGGRIFPEIDFIQVISTELLPPAGPGGGSPLSGWIGASNEFGAYSINLTGALFIPEPSYSAVFLALGLIVFLFRDKLKKASVRWNS